MAQTKQTNRTLPQIAKAIKVLEKKSIQNVIEIGKLLHEASEQCDHGEYGEWLKIEFSWSQQTAWNYRNVYNLAQNQKRFDFAKLDISISAVYSVARLMKGLGDVSDSETAQAISLAVGDAIIEAASHGRVSFRTVQGIIKRTVEEHDAETEEPVDEATDDKATDDEPNNVSSSQAAATRAAGQYEPEPEITKPMLRCSFCWNNQYDVKKLIQSNNVYICNECVAQCVDLVNTPSDPDKPSDMDMAKYLATRSLRNRATEALALANCNIDETEFDNDTARAVLDAFKAWSNIVRRMKDTMEKDEPVQNLEAIN